MKAKNHIIEDVVLTIYYLDKGEKVARHKHDFIHTTCCLAGKSEVIIDEKPPFKMYPGEGSVSLPGGIFHEVTALQDNTILMHAFKKEYLGMKTYPLSNFTPDIIRPGVLLDDGTIEYPDED